MNPHFGDIAKLREMVQVLHDNEQLADTIHPDATLETLHSLPDIVRAWR